MSEIFICYQTNNTSETASTLLETLINNIGNGHVFMDKENINAGDYFPNHIARALEQTKIMLVLIGDKWGKQNSHGLTIFDDGNYIHQEISYALSNPNIHVVPILVNRETMPSKDEIPEDIAKLLSINAIKIKSTPTNTQLNDIVFLAKRKVNSSENYLSKNESDKTDAITPYLFIPLFFLTYVGFRSGGLQYDPAYLYPALAMLLALNYGRHGFYASLIAGLPHLSLISGDGWFFGSIYLEIYIAGILGAYYFSSRENFERLLYKPIQYKYFLLILIPTIIFIFINVIFKYRIAPGINLYIATISYFFLFFLLFFSGINNADKRVYYAGTVLAFIITFALQGLSVMIEDKEISTPIFGPFDYFLFRLRDSFGIPSVLLLITAYYTGHILRKRSIGLSLPTKRVIFIISLFLLALWQAPLIITTISHSLGYTEVNLRGTSFNNVALYASALIIGIGLKPKVIEIVFVTLTFLALLAFITLPTVSKSTFFGITSYDVSFDIAIPISWVSYLLLGAVLAKGADCRREYADKVNP